MAYMIMLVANNMEQIDSVMDAWQADHVDDIVFMESTCFHRAERQRPRIPMRFLFESMDRGQQQVSVTLFGIVGDEAAVEHCIGQAEEVIGDLDADPNAMLVAWPLPIIKGYPKHPPALRGDDE